MDAEDTHDGGRNHRPYMDSFGVDKFQSIVEKIFNNSRTLRYVWHLYTPRFLLNLACRIKIFLHPGKE